MTIQELETEPLTPALAYIIGMVFPLYKEKTDHSGKKYITGCVNHNDVTDAELAIHFKAVLELVGKYNLNIAIKNNKMSDFSISSKKGFSVLIENTNTSLAESIRILTKRVTDIRDCSDNNIKLEFMKACFDGRGSWDTTLHTFSVDCDRYNDNPNKVAYERQDLIKSIFDDYRISVQINRRAPDHKKNDQLRIRLVSIQNFLDVVGLYSAARLNILRKGLKEL